MKTRRIFLLVSSLALLSCAQQQQPQCINLPIDTTESEKEISTKLSAELVAEIGNPSLEFTYKNKLKNAYATLDQNALQQLVLIEFLACIKKHHQKDMSPQTIAAMEDALVQAIKKATGVRSLRGPLPPGSKQKLSGTQFGSQKLSAISKLNL